MAQVLLKYVASKYKSAQTYSALDLDLVKAKWTEGQLPCLDLRFVRYYQAPQNDMETVSAVREYRVSPALQSGVLGNWLETIVIFVFGGVMTASALLLIVSQWALLLNPFFVMGSVFLLASFVTPLLGYLLRRS